MAEDKTHLLEHYRRMREELLRAIDGLPDAQLIEPSLDGWSVKDHLAHVAFWDDLRTGEVLRISAGHEPAWRGTESQAEALNAVAHALRQAFSLEQVRWELRASHQRLLDAISSATARGLDPSLYGDAALRSTHEAEHTGWITRWRSQQGA